MVTKAIVHRIVSDTEVIVKVPAFDLVEEEAGEDDVNSLPRARIATTPGCIPKFKVNDTVYVCIEDNDLSKPIIMGVLVTSQPEPTRSTSDATFESLKVNVNAILPEDTSIGDVGKENIQMLCGVNSNIQKQFDDNMVQKKDMIKFMTDTINTYFPFGG